MKPLFLSFVCAAGNSPFYLPAVGVLRINPEKLDETLRLGDHVKELNGNISRQVDPADVRWLEEVGVDPDLQSIGPISGFFDPTVDRLVTGGVLQELEAHLQRVEGENKDYPLPVKDVFIEVQYNRGDPVVFLRAQSRDEEFVSVPLEWADVARSIEEVRAPLQAVTQLRAEFDETEAATILAALTHYVRTGQGDPDARTDEIHGLATGIDDSVISMDDEGVEGLIGKIKAQMLVQQEARRQTVLAGENPKYFETKVTVTVLSDGEGGSKVGDMDLGSIAYEIGQGDWVGKMEVSAPVPLSADAMSKRLVELGSEPSFFGLDDDEYDEHGVHQSMRPRGN